jgi:hypothetical protein
MKTHIIFLLILFSSFGLSAQRFDLGNYLNPTPDEFELLGISSKTGVNSYKYRKEITDRFFGRKIGDIIVGVRDNIIVMTIYNVIPNPDDVGVPADIVKLIRENLPFPLKEIDGAYGVNIDNETIGISRERNPLTFNLDRIMFLNSVKQSILESTKK